MDQKINEKTPVTKQVTSKTSSSVKPLPTGLKIIDLSVIIPTFNEIKYLPKLLDSFLTQKEYYPREIIIGDGDSTDGTKESALAYPHVQVVYGGDHPGKGRNYGAKVATSSILLFLDGDTILPDNFLKNTYDEYCSKKLDGATVGLWCYNSKHLGDRLLYFGNNLAQNLCQFAKSAVGSGMCLYFGRAIFEKLNGFDESVVYAEDVDLVRRVVQAGGKWRILKSAKIWVTNRRFLKEGRLRMVKLFLGTAIHMFFHGPDRKNRYNYTFGHK